MVVACLMSQMGNSELSRRIDGNLEKNGRIDLSKICENKNEHLRLDKILLPTISHKMLLNLQRLKTILVVTIKL